MTMFTPGDRSEKIGVRLDSLVTSESWGEIWRATHDTLSRVLVVAYKREEGRNLFLAAREGFDTWKRLAQSGKPGLLKIHKIVSSGKTPMLVVEDPGGETAREFFSSDAATLKKTARMVRDCCHALVALRSERILPLGITPDTIIRKEGEKDYPAWLIPVSPGVFGDAVRLGDGRYVSPDALLLGDRESVNADVYSLAWIWAELLARDHTLDHQASRLRSTVHYPKLREIIRNALVFRNDQFLDPKKLEFEAEQWLENDATADREAYELWAEKQKSERRKRRRNRRKRDRAAGFPEAPVAPAAGRDPSDQKHGGSGTAEEFGDGPSDQAEEEDELAFARDIPPLAEPSARMAGADEAEDGPGPKRATAASSSTQQPDSTSSFFPVLLTGCFILIIISAFSAGLWILLAGGDGESPPVRIAEVREDGMDESSTPDGIEDDDGPVTPTATETETPSSAAAPVSDTPVSETTPAPSPAPGASPDSVDALLAAFREANRQRDLQSIRNLYFEDREFEAVRGILGTLTAENGELATLDFVERPGGVTATPEFQSVGMLRVSTSAFNLEIPVGREGDRFFLTSVGRVGGLQPPASTPEPEEEPLEFAAWTRGAWPEPVPERRLLRIGLGGEETRAVVVLDRSEEGDEPFEFRATLSNPRPEKIYYGIVMQVTDAEDRLIAVGAGEGALEPGTNEIRHKGKFIAGDEILSAADSYEARWYESTVPLGLVGARVVKNPRIPVGFGRGYGFQMGDEGQVQGRIYTDYINNQKVIAAPVLFRNDEDLPLDAVCSLAFYDSKGRLVSGRSQRARVQASSIQPFESLICSLPQGAYGEVTSFQAVMFIDGKEIARISETLPVGEETGDLISEAAPTPEPAPDATPTPLPASAAAESTDYRPPDRDMTVEETLAMMDSARPPAEPGAPVGDWAESGGFDEAGEAAPSPQPFSDEDVERFGRIASGIGTAWMIISVVFGYFIAAFCFQKIMEKSGKKDLALVAWIPVVNWVAVPWLISGRPLLFLILVYVVPCLGLFFYIAMWYDVCVARNKNGVWAFVAVFIPILGVPYLAFSE